MLVGINSCTIGCLYRQLYRDDTFISKNDMKINAHDRLSNITLRNKVNHQRFYCYFNFDSHCIVMINAHTLKWVWNGPYPEVKGYSTSTDKSSSRHLCRLDDILVCRILLPRCGIINKTTKYRWSNLTNSVIIVLDITLPIYKYRKNKPHGSHQVNDKEIRQLY